MNVPGRHRLALVIIPLVLVVAGCSERNPSELEVARAKIDPVVFEDGFTDDVYPQPFSGTYTEALQVDSTFAQKGMASLRVTVPPAGSALGAFAGGVLTSVDVRDLTEFNALTFYARSSVNSQLNIAGFGNDNTGTSKYEAGRANIPLTTDWTFVVVPIPRPDLLIAERGLFTYAEGFEPQHRDGHTIWFDDIQYANLRNVTDPRPFMTAGGDTTTLEVFAGATTSLSGTYTLFDVDGATVRVDHFPDYFDFVSSAPAVATVRGSEVVVVGTGEALVGATMGDLDVAGAIDVTAYEPPASPAPTPTVPAADVISLFSGTYNDVPVDTWNTHWNFSTTQDAMYAVDGNATRMYSQLNFVGIEFLTRTVDATAMTHFHIDVYAPEGTNFLVKLVAFDGDEGHLTGQSELTFDADSTPAFVAGQWSSLDIPLADFGFTVPLDHVGQLVLSTADASLVLVDNVYFHR